MSLGNPHPLMRSECLCTTRSDGGVDCFDPFRQRMVCFSADDAATLRSGGDAANTLLRATGLLEGPDADALRWETVWAKAPRRPTPPNTDTPVEGPWADATDWDPDWVSQEWRNPERLRRLAEDRAAGQSLLNLQGFVPEATARALASEVAQSPFTRLETELLQADRVLLGPSDGDSLRAGWRRWLESDRTRALISALLGRPMPPGIVGNAWRLNAGDFFGPHPDGPAYHGTASLGLCEGWRATDGGAIAFGTPTATGFQVERRVLPHLGDLLLFAPSAQSWHIVETVTAPQRLTLTAWWTPVESAL